MKYCVDTYTPSAGNAVLACMGGSQVGKFIFTCSSILRLTRWQVSYTLQKNLRPGVDKNTLGRGRCPLHCLVFEFVVDHFHMNIAIRRLIIKNAHGFDKRGQVCMCCKPFKEMGGNICVYAPPSVTRFHLGWGKIS